MCLVFRAEPAGSRLRTRLCSCARCRPRLPGGADNQAWVYAHGPALAARGLSEADLVSGIEAVDDEGAALLLAGSDATIVY